MVADLELSEELRQWFHQVFAAGRGVKVSVVDRLDVIDERGDSVGWWR